MCRLVHVRLIEPADFVSYISKSGKNVFVSFESTDVAPFSAARQLTARLQSSFRIDYTRSDLQRTLGTYW